LNKVMMEFLEYIGTWSVLKWVVLVLIAGFIGQFGRMAAEAVAAKIRKRHSKQNALPDDSTKPSIQQSSPPSPVTEVPDKKMLKALAKAKKKEAKKKD